MFEVNKKYKLILKNESVFTAKIMCEDALFVKIIDKNNQEIGISKDNIKEYRKIKENGFY